MVKCSECKHISCPTFFGKFFGGEDMCGNPKVTTIVDHNGDPKFRRMWCSIRNQFNNCEFFEEKGGE